MCLSCLIEFCSYVFPDQMYTHPYLGNYNEDDDYCANSGIDEEDEFTGGGETLFEEECPFHKMKTMS